MKHAIFEEGFAFRLRPVRREDAPLIVELRRDPERTRFLNAIPLTIAAQEDFLDRYFERPGDYYFVIEERASGRAEGLIGMYDLEARTAQYGRWVLRPGSLAAVESILMLYRIGFESFDLQEVYGRTVKNNTRVVSFHDSCGLQRRPCPVSVELHGQVEEFVEHVLTRSRWPLVRDKLTRLARSAA